MAEDHESLPIKDGIHRDAPAKPEGKKPEFTPPTDPVDPVTPNSTPGITLDHPVIVEDPAGNRYAADHAGNKPTALDTDRDQTDSKLKPTAQK